MNSAYENLVQLRGEYWFREEEEEEDGIEIEEGKFLRRLRLKFLLAAS